MPISCECFLNACLPKLVLSPLFNSPTPPSNNTTPPTPLSPIVVAAHLSPVCTSPSGPSTIPSKQVSDSSELEAKQSYRERVRAKNKVVSKKNKAGHPSMQQAKTECSHIQLWERQGCDAMVVHAETRFQHLKAAASRFSGSPKDLEQVEWLLAPSRINSTLWSLLPIEYK